MLAICRSRLACTAAASRLLHQVAAVHPGPRELPALRSPRPPPQRAFATISPPAGATPPTEGPLDETVLRARAKGLEQQADTGAGSAPVLNPKINAATINVTIGGESAPKETAQHRHLTPEEHAQRATPSVHRTDKDWTLTHAIWKSDYIGQVKYTHLPPQNNTDKLALWTIKTIRFNFDWMSGYSFGKITESKALTRVVFLETVAGVPGSVAATVRHLARSAKDTTGTATRTCGL
jgi:hypothetical protein